MLNTHGEAIKRLQAQVQTVMTGGKPSDNGQGDINAPDTIVNEDGSTLEVTDKNVTQLGQLQSIMSMIGQLGGNKDKLNLDSIATLVAYREAIDKLVPPNPYETLATQIGIKALEAFTKRIGVTAVETNT